MTKLIGQQPQQVPTNADLGDMAYQSKDNLVVGDVEAVGTTNFTDKQGVDRLHISGGGGGAVFNHNDNSPFKFQFSGASDVVRITNSGNVGIGDTDPDNHYGAEHRLVVRENQDGPTQAVVTNSNVSGSASSVYKWITGTGNSYMTHTLHDGNGTPFARLSMGTAVINYDIYIDNTQAFLIRGSNKEVVIPSGKLELDGNDIGGTQVTIADDAVASITPPRNGGFMFITDDGNGSFPSTVRSGFVFYDVGDSLNIQKQTTVGTVGDSLNVSTSNVTGTTGTDGFITVAVQSGVIKIENRGGSSKTYQITFL